MNHVHNAASGWSAHRWCYLDDGGVTLRFLLGDGGTLLAYLAIPVLLLYVRRRRPDLMSPWFFWSFSAFILSCGLGHGIFLVTLWEPWYGLESWWSILTAILSVATGITFLRDLPRLLKLASPADYEAAVNRAVAAETRAETAVARAEGLAARMSHPGAAS